MPAHLAGRDAPGAPIALAPFHNARYGNPKTRPD
jgi:hypothetical protein